MNGCQPARAKLRFPARGPTGMISKLFWVLLTAVFTFLFVVLFEDGTVNYVDNCQMEFAQLRTYFGEKPHKKPDTSDKL